MKSSRPSVDQLTSARSKWLLPSLTIKTGRFILLGLLALASLPALAANVDLQISQFTDTPDPAPRGGLVTYTIKVENNSATVANNVSVTVPLPATTTFVSIDDAATPGACTLNGGIPTCTYATLSGSQAGGPVKTITFKLQTTPATGLTIAPTVSVATSDTDTNASNNSLAQNTTIDDGADTYLTIAAPNSATAGSNVTWTFSGGNNGPNDTTAAVVTIPLPNTLTFISASGGGFSCGTSGSPTIVTCTRSALVNGASFNNLLLVTKLSGVSGGTFTLGASISSAVSDPDSLNNSPTHDVTVNAGADLRVTQASSFSGISSQPVIFTVNASNLGPSPSIYGVTVQYQLPSGFTFNSAAATTGAGWSCTNTPDPVLVTCVNNGNFASGRNDVLSINATAPSVAVPTAYNNIPATISVNPDSGSPPFAPTDPVASNNTALTNLTISPDGVGLTISKGRSPNPVAQGSNITSTLNVVNQGPQTAASGTIEIIDTIDTSKEVFVSGTGTNWSCNAFGPNSLKCTYGVLNGTTMLASGATTTTLTVVTTALITGTTYTATNNGTVNYTGSGGNWNSANNNISASVVATASNASVDISLSKVASTVGGDAKRLEFNESRLTYTLVLTNKASNALNIDSQDVVITDNIPSFIAGSTVVSVTPGAASGTSDATFACNVNAANGTVTCTQNAGTLLKRGDSVPIVIQVDRPMLDGTALGNTATAFSTTQGDPLRSDNTPTETVRVDPIADVEMVDKQITSANPAKAGTNVTYVLTFKNNGPSSAANVNVSDAFTIGAGDPGFTFISATSTKSGATCSGLVAGTSYGTGVNTLNCSMGTMVNGEVASITVIVRPNWKSGQTAGTFWQINNAANISTSTKEDTASGTGTATDGPINATLNVDAAAIDALVNNTDTVDPLGYDPSTGGNNANNDVNYQVNLVNRGPSLATGVNFTYVMTPPNGKTVTFRGDSATLGGSLAGSICNNVGNSVTGPATLTLTCSLGANLAANGNTNRFLVFRVITAPNPGGDTYNTNATVSTNETDSNGANNSEAETTTIRVRADITLIKTPSINPVQLRQPFNWSIVVTNNGPGASQTTTFADTLPAGMAFSGATPSWVKSTGGTGTCATAGQVLTCNFGTVNAVANVTVTVPVRMTAYPTGGTIQNCATATTSEVDPSSANNTTVCGTVGVQKSSVAGLVYGDSNNSGAFNTGEGGIGAVALTLTGTDIYGNPVNLAGVTAADGTYLFDNLSPSTAYTITESQPAGYGDGQETIGSVGGSTPVNDQMLLNLQGNTAATGYNFGELSVSIAGKVFADNNNNSVFNAGEPGIAGTTITLSGTTSGGVNVCTVIASCTVTTAADGSWAFPALPPSNASGYTVVETQPVNYTQGGNQLGSQGELGAHVADRFIVDLSTGGTNATNYNFGEIAVFAGTTGVSGRVWIDKDHDGKYNGSPNDVTTLGLITAVGWTVELLNGSGALVASQQTNSSGQYAFTGVPAGSGYQIVFRHPTTNQIYGRAVTYENGTPSNPGGADTSDGTLRNITLVAGTPITQQSLPLDPAGVVYDAVTRNPVAGAVVTINGPAGFNPATDLVGGPATQNQTTGIDGLYSFLLNPSAPTGVYTLTVTNYPAGYNPLPSTIIPVCTATLTVGSNPPTNNLSIQTSNLAPAAGTTLHNPATCEALSGNLNATNQATTQYYFSFRLDVATSANVLNNHIPLDPILGGSVIVTKTTPLVNVTKGDLVPYTILVRNSLATTINVQDRIPPGFKYRTGSATVNGVAIEPTAAGRDLTWVNQSFTAGESKTYKLILIVGTGVGEGEYINQAWALNGAAGTLLSNVASATVRVTPDPTFDCSDIIGKVFDDQNANGYQDEGEPGIANVRVVTVRGLLVTTDPEGRFHVACADIPQADHGANFVMKLDERTLPSGYRLTTENPRDVRVTRGKMVKLNFGATVHRVVRLDLNGAAFAPNQTDLLPEWQQALEGMPNRLASRPSILRIAYNPDSDDPALCKKRLEAVAKKMNQLWKDKQKGGGANAPLYPLVIETAVEAQQ